MKRTIQTLGIVVFLTGGMLGFTGSAIAQMDPDRGDGFDFNRAGSGYGGFYNESQRRGSSGDGSGGRSTLRTITRRTVDQRSTAVTRYADLKEKLGADHPDLRRAASLINRGRSSQRRANEYRRFSENDRADSAERSAQSSYRQANEILEELYRR